LFKEMMQKIVAIQPGDGLWRTNFLSSSLYPTPETSGSALFCYGLAWGINKNILKEYQYKLALEKAWSGLVSKIDTEGKLGWAQGVASKPGEVDPANAEIYATGAFLLAGSEMYKLVKD
jgi:rhamnogalacturonyl hydrolase YesR